MVKLTAVETHLFFRWAGGWGAPSALKGAYAGVEPVVAKIASFSPAHAVAGHEDRALLATLQEGMMAKPAASALPLPPRILFRSGAEIVILLNKSASPDSFADAARELCGPLAFCKVRGWADPANAPSQLPVATTSLASMSFSYLRNSEQRFEKALWNCGQFARPNKRECMKIPFPQFAKLAERTVVRAAAENVQSATQLPAAKETVTFK